MTPRKRTGAPATDAPKPRKRAAAARKSAGSAQDRPGTYAAEVPPEVVAPVVPPDVPSEPVRMPQEHHLDAGLVDYGMWIRMFEEAPVPAPPPEGFRRGRIWA